MECAECDNLLCHYESLTFATARIESTLEIANRMYDVEAVQRLTLEAYHLAAQQRDARAALARHRNSVHQVVRVASRRDDRVERERRTDAKTTSRPPRSFPPQVSSPNRDVRSVALSLSGQLPSSASLRHCRVLVRVD